MTLRVLLAEHDEDLNLRLAPVLIQEGFDVSLATDGDEALRLMHEQKPDFIILDRMIPAMDGIRICRRVRMEPTLSEATIIMLSSSEDVAERLLAFDVGADDYLSRPFEIEELLARIKVLKRRHPAATSSRTLRAGNIEMDLDRWMVAVSGQLVELTVKEYRLLQELLEAKGRVLSRDTLLERVWQHERELDIHTRTVDVHIGRLRSKLGPAGTNILTVRNIGYRIDITSDWIKH